MQILNSFIKLHVSLICFTCILLLDLGVVSSESKPQNIKVNIVPTFNNLPILKNKWYVSKNKDSIQFSKLKFYLTGFKVKNKNAHVLNLENANYLIDAFNEESLQFDLPTSNDPLNDTLIFSIGVQEQMNTSGALSGALDPVNGMFWSWQSGYINFKIEGKSTSCKTRKNKFQFHIGGYQKPYATTRTVSLDLNTVKKETIDITIDISKLFNNIHLNTENQIMIPGEDANNMADRLPKLFYINE